MQHPNDYPTLMPHPFTDVSVSTPDGAYWQESKDQPGLFQVIVVGPMLPPVFYRMALDRELGAEIEWVSQSFLPPELDALPAIAEVIRDRGAASFVLRKRPSFAKSTFVAPDSDAA